MAVIRLAGKGDQCADLDSLDIGLVGHLVRLIDYFAIEQGH